MLPKWLTSAIQPKGKTTFTFTAFKHDGQWFFNAPLLLTWWEGLAPAEDESSYLGRPRQQSRLE